MRTFVMGDIHGSWKALRQCLDRAAFDRHEDRLIQLGDVADGYDQVFECVEELLSLENLVAIRGNHDAWFLAYLRTGNHPDHWRQGGYGTLRSYLRPLGRAGDLQRTLAGYLTTLIPGDVPESHRHFFARQRLYYVDDENNCFVHGGYDRYRPFVTQREEVYLWDRNLWQEALCFEAMRRQAAQGGFREATAFHQVFIGHTATLYWNTDKPMRAAHIWNLDTGAGSTGRLTIMEQATGRYWQSDPMASLYPGGHRR